MKGLVHRDARPRQHHILVQLQRQYLQLREATLGGEIVIVYVLWYNMLIDIPTNIQLHVQLKLFFM